MLLCRLGGSKMVLRHDADEMPVHLLGEGAVEIVGAKPCFHMTHRDLQIEAAQGGGKGGGGIAMHQHQIRPAVLQHALHALQHA